MTDARVNLAVAAVATAPEPASSGGTLTVQSGKGSRFTAPCPVEIGPEGNVVAYAEAAEIGYLTKVTGDVLTITRGAEGPNGARAIQVGDVIRAGPTVKTFNEIAVPSVVAAPPKAEASADRAAIEAAFAALPATGGRVHLREGHYELGTTGLPAIGKPVHLLGCGANRKTGDTPATLVTINSKTATPFTVSADNCTFQHFGLQNLAAGPTEGSGIATTTGFGNGTQYLDMALRGFYRNIMHRFGSFFHIQRCYIGDAVAANILLENQDALDGGGGQLNENLIFAGPTNSTARPHGIQWRSGGGLHVIDTTVVPEAGAENGFCFVCEPVAGLVTSNINLLSNSFEGGQAAIVFTNQVSGTAAVRRILIIGNETEASALQEPGLIMETNEEGVYKDVIVIGNTFSVASGEQEHAMKFKNVSGLTYGGNNYQGVKPESPPVVFGAGVTLARTLEPTPWEKLTLTAKVEASGEPVPGSRQVQEGTQLRGTLKVPAGKAITAGGLPFVTVVKGKPSGVVPTPKLSYGKEGETPKLLSVTVAEGGGITTATGSPTINAGELIYLEGVIFVNSAS